MPFAGHAKLKFGIGENQSPLQRMIRRLGIDRQAQPAQLLRIFAADARHHLIEGNVLVVLAAHALGGGSENRFRQPLRLAHTRGQRYAANLARALVVFPS